MNTTLLDRPRSAEDEQSDPYCLTDEMIVDRVRGARWRRVAVVGDSLARGIGDPVDGYADRSWGDRVVDALRAANGRVLSLNTGVIGQTASQIRATQLRRALDFAPDLAIVSAGANDLLRRSFDPAAVESELDTIVGSLTEFGGLVMTFGLYDLSKTSWMAGDAGAELAARTVDLNKVSRVVAERHGGVYVDFFDHPGLDDSVFSADLIHPNRRGHAHIASSMIEALGGVRS